MPTCLQSLNVLWVPTLAPAQALYRKQADNVSISGGLEKILNGVSETEGLWMSSVQLLDTSSRTSLA